MLDREEYIEQSYLFRSMIDRMAMSESTQELLKALRDEILSTTKLPLAIDFMASEMRLTGTMHTAMAKLPHYFTPFQTYLVAEAEREAGKFDFRTALEILRREADYRAAGTTPQGMFLFQFECLCRNRLGYDRGLDAIAGDPIFDADWRSWIDAVRRQVGLVDFADLIYVRSELCAAASTAARAVGRRSWGGRRQNARHGNRGGRDQAAPRKGGAVWREGRPDCAGKSPERPVIPVCGAAAAAWLSGGAAAVAAERVAEHDSHDATAAPAAGDANEVARRGAQRRDRHHEVLW